MSPRRLAGDQSGFALLAVIFVLALLSVVVAEFAFSMRLEASMPVSGPAREETGKS